METPDLVNWKDLQESGKKEGPPFGTKPTRAMLYDLELPRFKCYLIEGKKKEYYVEYDRTYAVEWIKHHLHFVADIPWEHREKLFSEVFGRELPESDAEVLPSTRSKAKKRNSSVPAE